MEEYTRDSLRALRREAEAQPQRKQGGRWLTFLIILLFLLAGGFFFATQTGFDPKDAQKTIVEWAQSFTENIQNENDITKTVDAVLAEQNEAV